MSINHAKSIALFGALKIALWWFHKSSLPPQKLCGCNLLLITMASKLFGVSTHAIKCQRCQASFGLKPIMLQSSSSDSREDAQKRQPYGVGLYRFCMHRILMVAPLLTYVLQQFWPVTCCQWCPLYFQTCFSRFVLWCRRLSARFFSTNINERTWPYVSGICLESLWTTGPHTNIEVELTTIFKVLGSFFGKAYWTQPKITWMSINHAESKAVLAALNIALWWFHKRSLLPTMSKMSSILWAEAYHASVF